MRQHGAVAKMKSASATVSAAAVQKAVACAVEPGSPQCPGVAGHTEEALNILKSRAARGAGMDTGGTNGPLHRSGSTKVGDQECAKHQISEAKHVCRQGSVLVVPQDAQGWRKRGVGARVCSRSTVEAAPTEVKP